MKRTPLKKRKLVEDSGNATVPANVSSNSSSNQQEATSNQTDNTNGLTNEPPFGADDVENMDADQVLDYVYLNPPQNIDNATKQALYKKAEKIRIDRNNGMMTPSETEKMAKNIIANAQRMLKNKEAYNLQ